MTNNLQASSLDKSSQITFLSNPIEFKKKDFKNINCDTWLEINSNSLVLSAIEFKRVSYLAKLYSSEDYIFLDYQKDIAKKYKDKSSKNSFIIKIDINRKLNCKKCAISKNPLSITLVKDGKDFAYAKLYIKDLVFIEIKELL